MDITIRILFLLALGWCLVRRRRRCHVEFDRSPLSRTNEGGFQRLAMAPEYVYVLALSLDKVKQDGSYHRLKVKVDQDGLKLQARRGYFAPKREKK